MISRNLTWSLALMSVLASACGGASESADIDEQDADLIQGAEVQVGAPGGAEVGDVAQLPDGNLLVLRGGSVVKLAADLKSVAGFNLDWSPDKPVMHLVDGGAHFLLVSALGQISKHASSTGARELSFGDNGVVSLARVPGDVPVAASGRGKDGNVVLAIVEARNRTSTSPTSYFDYGPSQIAITELDPATGAMTKRATVTLPKSDHVDGIKVHRVLASSDGSFALVISQTEEGPRVGDLQPAPRTRFSLYRVTQSGAPSAIDLVAGGYSDVKLRALHEGPDGVTTAVFSSAIDTPLEASNKILSVSVDKNGVASPPALLGDYGAPLTGGTFSVACEAQIAFDGDDVLAARSLVSRKTGSYRIDLRRFDTGGAPPVTASLRTGQRCVRGVYPQPSGAVLVSAWDTTNFHGYRHLLIRLDGL